MRPSEALALHRDEIRALVARYRFTDLRVFGSTARGEDREDSDLDLLVTPSDTTTLFDIAAVEQRIEDLTGVAVHLTLSRTLKDHVRDNVLRDAIPI